MSSRSLTTAQKSAATRAAKLEQKRLEDIAFIAQNLGPRQAKKTAQKNAIWNGGQPSRKRTSSTPQASQITKRARETPAEDDQDLAEVESRPTQAKLKPKTSRSVYAAPPIDIDSESEPEEAPAEQKAVKSKGKATAVSKPAAKSQPAKVSKALVASTNKKVAAPARSSTKLVAESASEEEESSSAEEASDEAELSDGSGAENDNDQAPDEEEFLNERPQMITAKRRASPAKTALEDAESGMDSDKSREIDEVAPKNSKPKQPAKKAAEDLFSSSEDSDYMVGAPIELTTQRARRAARDSDDELHEAIADALVRIPLDARSRRSSTGSGWSSGRDLTIPDSEPESDAVSEPEVPQPRTKKVSAARQKKADLEKPEVRPAPAPAAAPSNSAIVAAADRPEASWDRSTRLVLPAPNKDIGLTAQHPEVQLMLRGTIDAQRMDLMIEDFYPTMITRVGFIRPKMIAAADIHPSTTHVKQRLMVDPKFAAILAPIPLDRINIQRGDVKRCAVSIVISMYRLNDLTPAEIKARVEELLKDHRYIFPVDPITGQMQLSLPFHHGSIKLVIKDQMMSSTVFKNRNYDRLPARHPKHPTAREVADPMVAMGATAIYASLLELRMTGERQPIAFTEDAFGDIYRIHIKTLEDTRAAAPIAMHKVLHQLFRDVTTSAQAVQTVAGSSATLISLVDVPNSD